VKIKKLHLEQLAIYDGFPHITNVLAFFGQMKTEDIHN